MNGVNGITRYSNTLGRYRKGGILSKKDVKALFGLEAEQNIPLLVEAHRESDNLRHLGKEFHPEPRVEDKNENKENDAELRKSFLVDIKV